MMRFKQTLMFLKSVAIFGFMAIATQVFAQGEVTRSGNTWSARVNGTTVYTGTRMFDAVNAACSSAGSGATINIRNSGDSGNDGGDVYAIRPLANQTLDFHGHTVNCNSNGHLVVAVYADRRDGITVRNLRVTGNPRYGVWFRGCSDVTLTNTTMELSNNSPVGLGIRVDHSTGAASNLTINGTTYISGSAGHALETYGINGINIGDVTANNTGGCGVLLNQSTNCTVGVVTGSYNNNGGGYATFRVANNNGSTYCAGVYSRNSGRGFFSVSGSRDCTVEWVDIADCTSHGIFLEDATNTHVLSGTVTNCNPNTQQVRTSNCSITLNGSGGGGGSYIQLRNRGTGLYLDGMGYTSNGDACGQWGNTTHYNSQWELVDQGSGYYQLRNRGTGLFLDGMGRTTNGADVGQWSNTSHYNSHWQLEQYDGNYHRLQNRNTGMYLDGMGRTTNGAACGQWSNTSHPNAQWEVINTTARLGEEIMKEQPLEVMLYPNPMENFLNIDFAQDQEAVLARIYSMSGELVFQQNLMDLKTKVDVRDFTRGVYLLELKTKSGSSTTKLIKQ